MLGRYNPFPAAPSALPEVPSYLPAFFFAGLFTLACLRFAAEASKNLENTTTPLTRWIAAVSAAEEFLTTKNTKNT